MSTQLIGANGVERDLGLVGKNHFSRLPLDCFEHILHAIDDPSLIRVVRRCWALDNDFGKTQTARKQFVKDETFWKGMYKVHFTEREFGGEGSIHDKVCELEHRFFGYGNAQCSIPTIDERLMQASKEGYEKVVKRLLEAGAHIETQDKREHHQELLHGAEGRTTGITPLHYAAQLGNEEVVKVLLEAGANIEATDFRGFTPLHKITTEGVRSVFIARLASDATYTPLHLAVIGCDVEAVKDLLSVGSNIEARNGKGERPLHLASQLGHEEIVKVLLEARANIEAEDTTGLAPLSYAVRLGYKKIVDYLLEAGAEVDFGSAFILSMGEL